MRFEDWGLIDYEEGVKKQMALVEALSNEQVEETVVFCSHPPVVTIGRGTKPGDVFGWSGNTVEVSRGGRATYHGPNQLVIYPVLDLRKDHKSFPARDVNAYLRFLENLVVGVLKEVGVDSEARTTKIEDGPNLTGVWVGQHKVASIGIAVRKWISYHGIAINIKKDDQAFQGINPCGFKSETMRSLEEVLESSDKLNTLNVSFENFFNQLIFDQ